MADHKFQEALRLFNGGDAEAGAYVARALLRSIDVFQSVAGLGEDLRRSLAHVVLSESVAEEVADRLTETVAEGLDLREIAGQIDLTELVGEIDLTDLVDASDVAGEFDVSEIASEIDASDLVGEIAEQIEVDYDALAEALDGSRVLDLIRDQLREEILEEIQDEIG